MYVTIIVLLTIYFYVYTGVSIVWKVNRLVKLLWKGKLSITTPLWKRIILWPAVELETIMEETK
jgi:hypothetical protein